MKNLSAALSMLTLLACGSKQRDGAAALEDFRAFVGRHFFVNERHPDLYNGAGKTAVCSMSTDVRATNAVAEPWEGLLRVQVSDYNLGGLYHDWGIFDLVFDRVGSEWVCNVLRSKASRETQLHPCEFVDGTCARTHPKWEDERRAEESPSRAPASEADKLKRTASEAWRDQLPQGAQRVSCHRKTRTVRQVRTDGETCRKEKRDTADGGFEVVRRCRPNYRSEPVEDDWCSFEAPQTR